MDILSVILLGAVILWGILAVVYLLRHGTCGCGVTGKSCCSSCKKCQGCHNHK